MVSLRWADGLRRGFHPLWLRDNCSSRRHAATRQKVASPADLPPTVRVADMQAADDVLHVGWEPTHASAFCAHWLRAHGFDLEPEAAEGLPAKRASTGLGTDVWRVPFDELWPDQDDARWRWTNALAEHGLTVLENVPASVASATGGGESVDGVRAVAEILGPMQPNIYGEIFDVVSAGDKDAINIAYTSEAIGPHMDLCYYESPPGIQLLHCLRFDEDVVGGGSFLIDAFAVAEGLKHSAPEAFATLSTVPATFVKDHSKRAQPVLLSYQRPHLSLDPHTQRVVGVFWSPPFEGPLAAGLPPHSVGDYYAAYRALHAAIEAAPRFEMRLQPGELLVFNNRRMLHGRHAFEAQRGGTRHLRGGYVNIDEFANRYNLLRRSSGGATADAALASAPLGNQDWATMTSTLPPSDPRP